MMFAIAESSVDVMNKFSPADLPQELRFNKMEILRFLIIANDTPEALMIRILFDVKGSLRLAGI